MVLLPSSKFSTNSHIECEPSENLYLEHSAVKHNSAKPALQYYLTLLYFILFYFIFSLPIYPYYYPSILFSFTHFTLYSGLH